MRCRCSDLGCIRIGIVSSLVRLRSSMAIGGSYFPKSTSLQAYNVVPQYIRLIDTAQMYRNEAEVGRAIRESRVPREHVFISASLLPNMGYWLVVKLDKQPRKSFRAHMDTISHCRLSKSPCLNLASVHIQDLHFPNAFILIKP